MTNHVIYTKKVSKRMRAFEAIVTLIALMMYLVPIGNVATAATLTTPRNYLNRQQADAASGVQHEVFFTAATAVSGGAGTNKVILVFPDADDGKWCRTAGTDLLITGITNATGVPAGSTEDATALPGTLTGACVKGTTTDSFDTITVSGVDNLSAATKYGVRIGQKASGPTGLLGTAATAANSIQVTLKTNNGTSDIDTAAMAVSLIASDQVAVTATVVPTLTVSLDTNTAALGTLDNTHVNQAGIVQTVTTNAGGGYISLAKYNATLTAGTNTIPDTSGGTIVAGTSEFGASSSQTGNTIGVWSPTACETTVTTSNATALTAAYQDYALSATPVSSQTATLCFAASVAGTQAAGVYSSTITVVTTARF